jgi:hypothetical protein
MTGEQRFAVDVGLEPAGDRSAVLRLWQTIPNMADAMAVIKEIERTYGPLTEFKFFRVRNWFRHR